MNNICLSLFQYLPKQKQIRIPSLVFGKPPEFFVTSHHTGRVIRFVPISPEHPLFDEDQWDGEMAIYEPDSGEIKSKISTAVIYNQY